MSQFLPTTIGEFDSLLTKRVRYQAQANDTIEFRCCFCQKWGRWPLEAYHPLGTLQPFCSEECRTQVQDAAKILEMLQILHGVPQEYVQ